ncbi:uncharacterized protein LOC130448642 [Diorhabda sublineata]|uniref:uncharacterized protein LOC130448642 n=1 Tax=Diorhabda sublineata TaxID=1163346 RepID=UPI0024E0CAAC|nr:uncharacterized protein LOC130448642 [Diorhabda sublineata]
MVIRRQFCLFSFIFVFLLQLGVKCQRLDEFRKVEDLVKKWSPVIWLSPEEKYFPLNVDDFLKYVYVSDENGETVMPHLNGKLPMYITERFNLMTHESVESLLNDSTSFLHGNSNLNKVSVYAVVHHCSTSPKSENENRVQRNLENNFYFHVTYWIFYPFNLGKDVCVLGRVPTLQVFNTCLGKVKTIGNHVGDWEHMSLSFVGKPIPDKLYIAAHTSGAYYIYNEKYRIFQLDGTIKKVGPRPKFPEIIRTQGEHPIVFSANGSHGMWATPGIQEYMKVPKVTDITGYGTPWFTWNNLRIFHLGYENLPYWFNFGGRWGNPKKKCLLFKKLGICEYSDGPTGILRKRQHFSCINNI